MGDHYPKLMRTFKINYVEYLTQYLEHSLVAQLVKNTPAMQETWVWSLGWEDTLEIPWRMEKLHTPVFWPGEFHGLYSSWGRKELDTIKWLSLSLSICEHKRSSRKPSFRSSGTSSEMTAPPTPGSVKSPYYTFLQLSVCLLYHLLEF